eukprot:TRINITY_DN71149_c0_g1_i1.p1 TRINITY_DN71149_c0_g1~~TRINITY_DN71149_c0_g1_i1.p1  ORF type:complete len:329 (-),score=57.36 TRINITY_DN71149_c0_g1_i1:27-1013(-)
MSCSSGYLHNFFGGMLRLGAKVAPENLGFLRSVCDSVIPEMLVYEGVRFETETIYTGQSFMDLEWVLPVSMDRSNIDTMRKVMVYMHGGAYVLCTPGSLRWCTAPIAICLDTALCVPDYRRAPEVSIETSIADGIFAYEYVVGTYPEAVHCLGGESAGGALAANMLLEFRKLKFPQPTFSMLMSPWTDLGGDDREAGLRHCSRKSTGKDYLTRRLVSWIAKEARGSSSGDDTVTSPVFVEGSLDDLPPILVIYGGDEVLCGQIEHFCDVWTSKNAPLQRHRVEEGKHAPILFSRVHEPSSKALDVLARSFALHRDKARNCEANQTGGV